MHRMERGGGREWPSRLPHVPPPRLTPLAHTCRGLGLVELLLIGGLALGAIVGGYALYRHSEAKQQLNQGVQALSDLARNVSRAFGTTGSYDGLNTQAVFSAGAMPHPIQVDPATGLGVNPWGGHITVSPEVWAGVSNAAFSVTYDGLPADACAGLSANAGHVSEVLINGTVANHTDPGTLAGLCAQSSNTAKFILASSGLAANASPALTPCTPPAPETQTQACPAGQVSSLPPYSANGITQQREASCPNPYGSATWGAWHQTGNTCAPVCVAPAPTTATQSLVCPVGQAGMWTQQQTTTWSCPTPVGTATSHTGDWTTTLNTCAPICGAAPAAVQQTLACPAGQTGSITQGHDWTSAPAPTCWTASPWTTLSNTCATPAPPPPVSPPADVCPWPGMGSAPAWCGQVPGGWVCGAHGGAPGYSIRCR